ncbi:MAG: hypothetical protein E7658_10335 [Ruminococcaceae bacterium]|nr:hypothetical protein [Oscillospiraceae bacterium]
MLTIKKATVIIPSLKNEYHFWHFSDAHIAHAYPEDTDEAHALAQKQAARWAMDGKPSSDVFLEVLAEAKKNHASLLLMAGDCVDYYSDSNIRFLTENLEKTEIPVLYVYGNHEGASYVKDLGDPKQFYPCYAGLMGETPDFQVKDFGEFLLIAVDNSAHNISEEQFVKLTEQFTKGVPVILVMHIPLSTIAIMPDMEAKWGKNPTYFMLGTEAEPEMTREFCRLVTAEDSPVAAIFAGHVHFMHAGEFSPGRMQYTSAPGCCWDITVKGE